MNNQRNKSFYSNISNFFARSSNGIFALVATLLMSVALPAHAALTISAANTVSPVLPGEVRVIEFTVTNTDGFSRTGVTVDMVYPDNLNQLFEIEFDGDCPSTTCTVGETVTWTLGTIPAGGSTTVSFAPVVAVGAPDAAVISFAPTVSDDLADSDSSSTSVTVDSGATYDLSLSEGSDPVAAGELLTYTLNFGFREDAGAVTNSELSFDVPANTTFVSATDGGSESAGTVTWPLGFLSPGDGGFRKVTVTIDGGVSSGDVIPATAAISAVADPGNNATSQVNTAVSTTAGLQIAFETSVNPVRAGDLTHTALTVTNRDPFTRFGVEIGGYYPQNLNQLFELENDVNCSSTTCNAGERMTWTLGDIPAGGSVTTVIVPVVTAGTAGGVLINTPLIASDVSGLEERTLHTLRVQNDTLYDLSLAENRDPAPANSELIYSIDFAYRADAASVSNSLLRLPLPAGTTFVSASDGGSVNSGAVEWPLGFLSPGQSGRRTATLMLDAGLSNGAVVNAEALLSSVTSTLERAAAQTNTVIASSGGLRLAIESNTHPIRDGEGGYMQLTACNTDPFTRFGITLNTFFPEALNQQFETEFEGNCSSTTCNAGEDLEWTLGNLLAGACTTTSFFPVPTGGTPSGTLIPFFVQAADDAGLETRRIETYRTDSDSKYDLALAEYTDPATAGSELTYLLTFAHRVDAAAVSNTIMRLPLPAGTTFVSATDGGVLNSGVVEWNLGFLSPGDGGQREVTVTIGAGTVAGTVIEAEATIANVTTPLQNTRAEANTTVATSNDLQIAIEPNANPGRQQELINYRMTVTNPGPFSRFGVTLTGGYPQDLDQVFETTFDGNCASTTCSFGELVTWSLGEIPSGVAKSVDLPPVISSGATEGELINFFAKVQDDQGAQAQQLGSVRVQGDTIYDLAMNVSADPVTPGSTISYQVVYGYRQDAGVTNDSRIRLPLPAGATFVSATGGGTFSADTVEWNLGFLSPGDGGIVEAVVMLDGGLAAGSVVEAAAEVFSLSSPLERARAKADAIVLASVPLSLDVNALTVTAEPNRRLNLEITVTNNDPFTRFGVSLQSNYPQDLVQLFESDPDFIGDCASTTCSTLELVQWPLVDLAAGESFTVTFPPTVTSGAVEGSLINFPFRVKDDQGAEARGTQSLYNGCISEIDGDCDGVADSIDNCTIIANPDQRDTNGDGYGNRCDPDINNDGVVNFADIGLWVPLFNTACGDVDEDFSGDGSCNFGDYALFPQYFLQPPGPGAIDN